MRVIAGRLGILLTLVELARGELWGHVGASLARVAAGVYRLEGQLLVVLDVDCVLDIRSGAAAA